MKLDTGATQTAIPLLFVLLWSTGFTMAKLGLPYVEAMTFLTVRFFLAASVLVLVILFLQGRKTLEPIEYFHCAVVGLLLHAVYLGGVFAAVDRGLDAGLSALIVSLQPVLTLILGSILLGESLSRKKIVGTALGFIGVAIVLQQRGLDWSGADRLSLLLCVASLIGISVGTLYQKKFVVNVPHIPSVCTQYVVASAVLLPLAQSFETMQIQWTGTFIFSLTWLVVVLSLGAVFLLMLMIRAGEVSRVASFIYLVPPFVVIEAYFMFGETLTALALMGIGLCIAGVAMVTRSN
ncbi:MAG: DMT family transporter [Gammaproteobacteria bacterium]|nr:DMT family transporter [Gammaproteobacteria bacterium]